MLPDWLVAHLAETGRDNPDGVDRAARQGRCFDCGAEVLRGLDDDRCARAVTCDPAEIDLFGEQVAVLGGARTYMLTFATNSSGKTVTHLDPRDPIAIRAGQRTALVAQHRCGIALPPAARSYLPAWRQVRHVVPEHPDF